MVVYLKNQLNLKDDLWKSMPWIFFLKQKSKILFKYEKE